MDEDPPQGHQSLNQKAQTLISITTGNSLSSSISKLSGSSRALPSDKDFHFYNNFDEFNKPIKEIDVNSKSALELIDSSSHIFGKKMAYPEDNDDAYDWLVSVNDEMFERFDSSIDEFHRVRKTEETENNGFQLVCGKKKKALSNSMDIDVVKVASRDSRTMGGKQKVPFHIPTIPRPQNEFSILVNNANTRFEHVWLPKSEDGSRFVHPLENLSVLDFVDSSIEDTELVRPPPVECSSFKLVEDVKALKDLAAKLRSVNEFAVDLEHNQYRSFQGLTCLMQISTRAEDFVVDTLKLRIHIGPYLRDIFKNPTKKKVMHGADRDIEWLQRDFGIYICNLFDTGQASRVLKLERNSLEFLLQHFCGVTANKEYQKADWRLRPLPDVMLRYAREDTHYLLHIYDLLRVKLLTSNDTGNSDPPLVEVYKRSYDICMHLYEKELLTDTSYLHIYGMQEVDFTAEQLAIVAGLCEWRDSIARAEDESTGYILPNKVLLEIAKQMPATASKLRHLLRSKHPYIDQNIGSVVNIIKHAIHNAGAFETVVQQLKKERLEMASREVVEADGSELTSPQALASMKAFDVTSVSIKGDITVNGTILCAAKDYLENGSTTTEPHRDEKRVSSEHLGKNGVAIEVDSFIPGNQRETFCIPGQVRDTNDTSLAHSKVTGATVQALKKPSRAFGALLGSSASKRKFDMVKNGKEALKMEQIKSSVNLPFHSFTGKDEQLKQVVEKHTEALRVEESDLATNSNLEDVILLEVDSAVEEESLGEDPETQNATKVVEYNEDGDEPMSLSELSSSFKKCFPANHQTINKGRQQAQKKVEEPAGLSEVKPFDYEAAKLQVRFDGKAEKHSKLESNEKRKSSGGKKSSAQKKDEENGDFQQGRRRQAFPATGNRSATFR